MSWVFQKYQNIRDSVARYGFAIRDLVWCVFCMVILDCCFWMVIVAYRFCMASFECRWHFHHLMNNLFWVWTISKEQKIYLPKIFWISFWWLKRRFENPSMKSTEMGRRTLKKQSMWYHTGSKQSSVRLCINECFFCIFMHFQYFSPKQLRRRQFHNLVKYVLIKTELCFWRHCYSNLSSSTNKLTSLMLGMNVGCLVYSLVPLRRFVLCFVEYFFGICCNTLFPLHSPHEMAAWPT